MGAPTAQPEDTVMRTPLRAASVLRALTVYQMLQFAPLATLIHSVSQILPPAIHFVHLGPI